MIEIETLSGDAATDEALGLAVSKLVNRAYEIAEEGLWLGGVARTTPAETSDAVALGEQAVARDNGRLVGSIRRVEAALATQFRASKGP